MSIKNNNYKDYLSSPYWQSRRAKALMLAGYKCEKCGCMSKLEVHHLGYRNIGNEPDDDLMVLCSRCHAFERNEINIYMQKKLMDFGFKRLSKNWQDYSDAKLLIPKGYNSEQYQDAIRSICDYLVL